jgi:hypothetical protein
MWGKEATMTQAATAEKTILPITAESTLTKRQRAKFGPKRIDYFGTPATIVAEVRYDDDCGNGHNTFAITGVIRAVDRRINPRDGGELAGGCLHDEIARSFPELAPLIKWHLCSSDGPMHYIPNTLYSASDRDCWGHRKGEPSSFNQAVQFGGNPIKHRISSSFSKFLQANRAGVGGEFDFEVIHYDYENRPGDSYKFAPKYTFGGYGEKWHECPFDTEGEALDFLKALQTCAPKFLSIPTAWSDGKEREFDAARHCAVWPEATDEELIAPDLKERLAARLPGLLAEFRAAVEGLGFVW